MIAQDKILEEYKKKHSTLKEYAQKLEQYLYDIVEEYPRIDRVTCRAKSPESFIIKAFKTEETGELKYNDPLNQVQDQLGARIVTYYLYDINEICNLVEDYFGPIESQKKQPDAHDRFGYDGQHYILLWPEDVYIEGPSKEHRPKLFELQIKTLFQHAWSEADHDLGYKNDEELTWEQRRKIAFTAAQAWGADNIFNELFHSCSGGKNEK